MRKAVKIRGEILMRMVYDVGNHRRPGVPCSRIGNSAEGLLW
jgi:hypothetical protein